MSNKKSFIRRVEVQVGIIMGVAMFSVLGVFLGIRKGEKKHEEVSVLTKVVDDTSDILDLKVLEQPLSAPVASTEGTKEVEPAGEHLQPTETTIVPSREVTTTPKEVVTVQGEKLPSSQEAAKPTADAPTATAASVPSTAVSGISTVMEEKALTPEVTTSLSTREPEQVKIVPRVQVTPTLPAISLPTTHTVKANETLMAIARKYYGEESRWTLIYEANHLANKDNLYVGQKLTIPNPKEYGGTKRILEQTTSKPDKGAPGRAHRVQKGDTLYQLARTYYGDESQWKKIYNANKDVFGGREELEPGDILIIP